MSDGTQGFWEGRNAMAAARKKAREEAATSGWSDCSHEKAEGILASAHYSRAGTLWTRGKYWLPFVAWHFWRARVHVRRLLARGFDHVSAEQLDVAGTILRRRPFPDFRRSLQCSYVGARRSHAKPHTLALLHLGSAECFHATGDSFSAMCAVSEAVVLIPRIEWEEPDLHGKRQLVRVLKHCGAYYRRFPETRSRGDEYLRQAEELAREVSPDQLAKIQASA